MRERNARVRCKSKMQERDARTRYKSKMQEQDARARCKSKIQENDILAIAWMIVEIGRSDSGPRPVVSRQTADDDDDHFILI